MHVSARHELRHRNEVALAKLAGEDCNDIRAVIVSPAQSVPRTDHHLPLPRLSERGRLSQQRVMEPGEDRFQFAAHLHIRRRPMGHPLLEVAKHELLDFVGNWRGVFEHHPVKLLSEVVHVARQIRRGRRKRLPLFIVSEAAHNKDSAPQQEAARCVLPALKMV